MKDAQDRFANAEIDYLLQRMERLDGLAILAANRKSAVDEAFPAALWRVRPRSARVTARRRWSYDSANPMDNAVHTLRMIVEAVTQAAACGASDGG